MLSQDFFQLRLDFAARHFCTQNNPRAKNISTLKLFHSVAIFFKIQSFDLSMFEAGTVELLKQAVKLNY